MALNTGNHWQRPSFVRLVSVLALCVALGVLLSWRARQFNANATNTSIFSSAPDGRSGLKTFPGPHPELTPREVVQRQMASIQALRDDAQQIDVCFAFASPGNRQMIGTSKNLLSVIRKNYSAMISGDRAEIEEAEIFDRNAAVLVTVIDVDSTVHAYRFYLSRQIEPPYQDCWMTDGVAHVGSLVPEHALEPSPSIKEESENANL